MPYVLLNMQEFPLFVIKYIHIATNMHGGVNIERSGQGDDPEVV
jgi:hypothetical protein